MSELPPLDDAVLPDGIRARMIPGINGLTMHVLEAGEPGNPCLLLLHGFPGAGLQSWRKVMPALAEAGYHVVAPDQRGYGRTTGWNADYDADLAPFRMLNLVRDPLGLVASLGLGHVDAVIGHDFGSPVAAWCALVRPDVFRSRGADERALRRPAARCPSTRQRAAARAGHRRACRSWRRWSGRASTTSGTIPSAKPNDEMWHCPQGVHAFLRAYYHIRARTGRATGPSARRLDRRGAGEAADLLRHGPGQGHGGDGGAGDAGAAAIAACQWLPDERAGRLRRGVWPHRLPGRAAMVPLPHAPAVRGRAAGLRRPHHRRAVVFIAGEQRLGRLADAGRARRHADELACTRHAGRASGGGRRPLGAAGAARAGHRPAAELAGQASGQRPFGLWWVGSGRAKPSLTSQARSRIDT